ncbi:MAG: GDP-L-fucose synthase [Phenylobacterium sp.]|nr:MAG: GDP-L-fucose synthase [Phenylobacterium sp.]
MVGAALVRRLAAEDCEVLTVDRATLDLRRRAETEAWVADARPDAVILAAARVGGIAANDAYPGEFLHDNLAIQTNVIEAARLSGVAKLLFLGSSCIYPKLAPQPMAEEALLTGPLEPTNEWYAIAKIAGLKLAQAYRRQYGCDFISAMPTNLYGPGDNFDLEASHVLPALIRKAYEAKVERRPELVVWGTGAPKREFLHVDDCADALVHLLKTYSADLHINVGSGQEVSIAELAELVTRVTGYEGKIVYDAAKPDGTPRKLLDTSRLRALGWAPRIDLATGITETCGWFAEFRGIRER